MFQSLRTLKNWHNSLSSLKTRWIHTQNTRALTTKGSWARGFLWKFWSRKVKSIAQTCAKKQKNLVRLLCIQLLIGQWVIYRNLRDQKVLSYFLLKAQETTHRQASLALVSHKLATLRLIINLNTIKATTQKKELLAEKLTIQHQIILWKGLTNKETKAPTSWAPSIDRINFSFNLWGITSVRSGNYFA